MMLWVLGACILAFIWTFRAKTPKGLVCPPANWFLGHALQLKGAVEQERLAEWLKGLVKQYGTFVLTMPFNAPRICISEPAHLKHILLDAFDRYPKGDGFHDGLEDFLGDGIFNVDGDKWREQRKGASHLFSHRQLRDNMSHVFEHHARVMISYLEALVDKAGPKGFQVDISALYHAYTLDAICEIAFGIPSRWIESVLCPESVTSEERERMRFGLAFDAIQLSVILVVLCACVTLIVFLPPLRQSCQRSIP